jgi:inosine/xanthosine triphosphatase
MLVVVGSDSRVKVEAARLAFEGYFGGVEVRGLPVASGVSPFPMSDEETLRGAVNRARGAAELEPGAEYSVGLEGGLSRMGGWLMVKQVAVVLGGGVAGLGLSPGYACPERLYGLIAGARDGVGREAIDSYLGEPEVLGGQGAIGVLTGGRMDRTHASMEAVVCALTRFMRPQYY